MLTEIRRIIEKIYAKEENSFFIERCQRKLDFLDDLSKKTSGYCRMIHLSNELDDPAVGLHFDIGEFSQGEFHVKYSSVLLISKVYDAFYLHHEFAVDNLDENRIEPILDGFDDQPYSKMQYMLDEAVTSFLQSENYIRLSYADMQEVIPNIDIPENCIFGTQMTVENAIFRDLWNLCS